MVVVKIELWPGPAGLWNFIKENQRMMKRDEISNPESCLNKAMPNEMIFVLLGRDVAAVPTVRSWIAERIRLKRNTADDKQILDAEKWIETVLNDQVTEPVGDEHCE